MYVCVLGGGCDAAVRAQLHTPRSGTRVHVCVLGCVCAMPQCVHNAHQGRLCPLQLWADGNRFHGAKVLRFRLGVGDVAGDKGGGRERKHHSAKTAQPARQSRRGSPNWVRALGDPGTWDLHTHIGAGGLVALVGLAGGDAAEAGAPLAGLPGVVGGPGGWGVGGGVGGGSHSKANTHTMHMHDCQKP